MDVYSMARQRNILVICEPLGEIQGYFHIVLNQKMIHLNELLTECQRKIIMCKLLFSEFNGKEFDLIHIESELSKCELMTMLFLNEFVVRCPFPVCGIDREQSVKTQRTEGFSNCKARPKTFSELLKMVS